MTQASPILDALNYFSGVLLFHMLIFYFLLVAANVFGILTGILLALATGYYCGCCDRRSVKYFIENHTEYMWILTILLGIYDLFGFFAAFCSLSLFIFCFVVGTLGEEFKRKEQMKMMRFLNDIMEDVKWFKTNCDGKEMMKLLNELMEEVESLVADCCREKEKEEGKEEVMKVMKMFDEIMEEVKKDYCREDEEKDKEEEEMEEETSEDKTSENETSNEEKEETSEDESSESETSEDSSESSDDDFEIVNCTP